MPHSLNRHPLPWCHRDFLSHQEPRSQLERSLLSYTLASFGFFCAHHPQGILTAQSMALVFGKLLPKALLRVGSSLKGIEWNPESCRAISTDSNGWRGAEPFDHPKATFWPSHALSLANLAGKRLPGADSQPAKTGVYTHKWLVLLSFSTCQAPYRNGFSDYAKK
jgi:hypothetical protein